MLLTRQLFYEMRGQSERQPHIGLARLGTRYVPTPPITRNYVGGLEKELTRTSMMKGFNNQIFVRPLAQSESGTGSQETRSNGERCVRSLLVL